MMETRKSASVISYAEDSGIGYNNPYLQIFLQMKHAPIDTYLTKEDKYILWRLATYPPYSEGTAEERMAIYDQIMNPRGFIRSYAGTNRVIYTHKDDPSFLLKIGLDSVGIKDNLDEFKNQKYLRPYVPKTFDVTPCGTIALSERVKPIMNREDFLKNASMIYDTITYLVNKGFVLEDIGTDFFMNWGVRHNFGPVLLDYPYLYRINKSRMRCIKYTQDHKPCGGKLVYEDGFNFIHCEKCGQRYAAKDVGTHIEVFKFKRRGKSVMRKNRDEIVVEVSIGNKKYTRPINPNASVDYVAKEEIIERVKTEKPKPVNNPAPRMYMGDSRTPTRKSISPNPNTKLESNPGFRHFRLIDDRLKPIMMQLGTELGFDPFRIPIMMEEYIAEYMQDHWTDYIDIKVICNPTSERRKLPAADKIQYDRRIDEEFEVPNGKVFVYELRSYITNMYISKAFPQVNEDAMYGTFQKAVRSYFAELKKSQEFEKKEKKEDFEKGNDELADALLDIANSEEWNPQAHEGEDIPVKTPDKQETVDINKVSFDNPNTLGAPIVADMAQDIIATKSKPKSTEF